MTVRIELADVVRRFGEPYIEQYGDVMMPSQRRAIRDIAACQTEALGGKRYQCIDCDRDFWHYHGCRNRSCPKCHGPQIEEWLARREAEVLPCGYFHAVVTVPEELRPIFLKHQKVMYGLLMRTSADCVRTLCQERNRLGGEPAIMAVLHSWTAQMKYHPHVHLLISAGGITPDGKSWREPRSEYLIPVKKLSRAVAIEFRKRLEKEHPKLFKQCNSTVWHKSWCSFIKSYGENREAVMRYLSRYVFRIAITNARLISIDGDHVTFRYKDRKSGTNRVMRLGGVEFLRRFLMHVLPRGFHKVRYYGLWHHSRRKLAESAWLLIMLSKSPDDGPTSISELIEAIALSTDDASDPMPSDSDTESVSFTMPRCPHCGSERTAFLGER